MLCRCFGSPFEYRIRNPCNTHTRTRKEKTKTKKPDLWIHPVTPFPHIPLQNQLANPVSVVVIRIIQDFEALSSVANHLKSSSATVGLFKIYNGCDDIVQIATDTNRNNSAESAYRSCFTQVAEKLQRAKDDTKEAERALQLYYGLSSES